MGELRPRILACLLLIALVFGMQSLSAQTRVGIKAGISTFDVSAPPVTIFDSSDVATSTMRIADTKIGLHIGFFVQANFGPVFIQPELVVNTQTVEFAFQQINGSEPEQIRDEIYQALDLPLIVGFKVGPVRVGGGPVAHLFLSSNSDIQDFEGYEQDFDILTYGWQAGIGIDIWKLHIDGRYEGNFTKFGNHMRFNGNAYEFDDEPSRWLMSIGISF